MRVITKVWRNGGNVPSFTSQRFADTRRQLLIDYADQLAPPSDEALTAIEHGLARVHAD